MPRKKTLRRFTPPPHVSRAMLEAETPRLAKEIDDYLVNSENELRRFVSERNEKVEQATTQLRSLLECLPIRHRLAIAAIVAREVLIAIELANTTILADDIELRAPNTAEPLEEHEVPAVPKFNEWLFDPKP